MTQEKRKTATAAALGFGGGVIYTVVLGIAAVMLTSVEGREVLMDARRRARLKASTIISNVRFRLGKKKDGKVIKGPWAV